MTANIIPPDMERHYRKIRAAADSIHARAITGLALTSKQVVRARWVARWLTSFQIAAQELTGYRLGVRIVERNEIKQPPRLIPPARTTVRWRADAIVTLLSGPLAAFAVRGASDSVIAEKLQLFPDYVVALSMLSSRERSVAKHLPTTILQLACLWPSIHERVMSGDTE